MRVNSIKLNNYYKIPKNNKIDNKKDRYGTPPYIDDDIYITERDIRFLQTLDCFKKC